MLCALIMAGGKGTRFWPLSTEEKPKQFLSLIGEETMIQMTVRRIEDIIPVERIFICTGERYVDLVKEQLPMIPEKNIIVEPEGRNTAPCVALSAMVIKRYFEDVTIAVLPSDHLIRDEEAFREILVTADEFVNEYKDSIVTLGMHPSRPETGYGYIKYSHNEKDINGTKVIKVDSFVEKPNMEKAAEYLKSGKYLWNGGMFLWNIDTIIGLTERFLPETYTSLNKVLTIEEDELQDEINENYKNADNISIDYGIMEKYDDIYVIPSEFGWDDVGNWTSIERYSEKDDKGNVFNSEGIPFKSKNNIVLTNKKILLNNVEDLIIVETEDYIMISSKKHEQDIKLAKGQLD